VVTAEILSQGDEVVTGQTADTNAAWLSTRLTDMGLSMMRHTSVGDRQDDIRDLFLAAAGRSDIVICTGGLGPTDDDLTAQAVADAFDRPLEFRQDAMDHIAALYARYNRPMPEVNRKQAWLPKGATMLTNHWGTAPAFSVEESGTLFFCFAGVPREMKALFDAYVVQTVTQRLQLTGGRLVTLRTAGVGESNLQERVGTVESTEYVVGYRSKLPENQVKLRFSAGVSDERIREVTADIAARIGSPVFTIEGLDDGDGGTLPQVVGKTLLQQGQTVATAESCTGGLVAAMFTGVPGSSEWFLEGAVTYSNASKLRQLGVDPATLEQHGAVSEPTARQMAEGIRKVSGATWGLSTTGIAGPGGGSDDKPVGLVHVAVAGPDQTHHRALRLGGDRHRIQQLAAAGIVDMLRRKLQHRL